MVVVISPQQLLSTPFSSRRSPWATVPTHLHKPQQPSGNSLLPLCLPRAAEPPLLQLPAPPPPPLTRLLTPNFPHAFVSSAALFPSLMALFPQAPTAFLRGSAVPCAEATAKPAGTGCNRLRLAGCGPRGLLTEAPPGLHCCCSHCTVSLDRRPQIFKARRNSSEKTTRPDGPGWRTAWLSSAQVTHSTQAVPKGSV